MSYSQIPICYFPSTTLFIDDSRDFLLNFVLQLDENLAYHVYDSPSEALKTIQKNRGQLELLNDRCMSQYMDAPNCPTTNHTVNLDLSVIAAEVYNSKRFSEISVVVVDYAMPGIDGIEFCRRLENTRIKKILLTGQADEHVAIQAFNEGLIHRYIHKNDPNASLQVLKSIHTLQQQYFEHMSETMIKMLSVNSPTCLKDAEFSTLIQQHMHEYGIVEYYLADHAGSFLMLDQDANPSFLIVKSTDDLKLYYDMALDNGADDMVLDCLTHGDKIPCFGQFSNTPPQGKEWHDVLVPANRFIADQTYYYAYVKKPMKYKIHQDKILSYHDYLEEIDKQALMK